MNNCHYLFSEQYFNEHFKTYILSLKDGRGRPSLISDYQFFCTVLYVLKTGVSWRNIPENYGS